MQVRSRSRRICTSRSRVITLVWYYDVLEEVMFCCGLKPNYCTCFVVSGMENDLFKLVHFFE